VFDVGGVFRDSKELVYLAFEQAFKHCGLYGEEYEFDKELLYKLRGLEMFNDVLQCCKAIYVTKGCGMVLYVNCFK
jgi:hypothetical protein